MSKYYLITHYFCRLLAKNVWFFTRFHSNDVRFWAFFSILNDKECILVYLSSVYFFSSDKLWTIFLHTDDSCCSSTNHCAITSVFPFKCCLKLGFHQHVNDKECMVVYIVRQFIAAPLVHCEQHFSNCRLFLPLGGEFFAILSAFWLKSCLRLHFCCCSSGNLWAKLS